jgi:hypothetical protein
VTRNKAGLITNSPLCLLTSQDFSKVNEIDSRYAGIIPRADLSWDWFRQKMKPYMITFESGNSIEMISNSRVNASKEASKSDSSRIVKIVVECKPNQFRELKVYSKEQMAERQRMYAERRKIAEEAE